ncbi:phenylalanine--tRNA ligase subunit beta [Ureaplasma diversum]|uniref:phenylalanine--tRNA ligase subunit beta n=1 Tax=Ureaplasma diversum TaxID=42094 RepID=UPI000A4F5619|nr:phenylalanine--tRNA ligase subunit beta [Ureaplasma diversum]
MIISWKYLQQLQPRFKKVSLDQLYDALMDLGCEVEYTKTLAKNTNLAIARVLKKQKHPNADKLNLVEVKTEDGIYNVVCGADNFNVNDYVVLAKVNATLGNGLVVTKRVIRDQVSNGMLCAYSELVPEFKNLLAKEDQEGIIVLEAQPRLLLSDPNQLLWLDDQLIEISLPSNRNDLNGYYWLIKELNAYFNFSPIGFESIDLKCEINHLTSKAKILSNDVNAYHLLEVNNLANYQTSWATKIILMYHNIKVHNHFADQMNLLSLLITNPLHAFDQSKVNGKITLKNADKDHEMVGLDNLVYKIKKNDLIIVDEQKTIALAGIIGSLDSCVDKNTKQVLVECANFNDLTVANTARRLKINTTAASRFSKPLTNYLTYIAFKNLVNYFSDDVNILYHQNNYHPTTLKNNLNNVSEIIGASVNIKQASSFLERLGYEINSKTIKTPMHRYDIVNDYDIYEDVMKINSINKIDPVPISIDILNFKQNQNYDFVYKLKQLLVSLGIYEAKTYNLKDYEQALSFDVFNFNKAYEIKNPISNIRTHFKLNNISSLLEVIKYNQYQKNELVNWFEISHINAIGLNQQTILTIVLAKPIFESLLSKNIVSLDLVSAKALLSKLMDHFLLDYQFSYDFNDPLVYSNNANAILNGSNQFVGFVGELNKKAKKAYDIGFDCYVINLNLTNYLNQNHQDIKINKPSVYQDIFRDLTISLSDDFDLEVVLNKIKTIKYVSDVYIKTVFRKDNITSYTFTIILNGYDHTLSSEEIKTIEDSSNQLVNELVA